MEERKSWQRHTILLGLLAIMLMLAMSACNKAAIPSYQPTARQTATPTATPSPSPTPTPTPSPTPTPTPSPTPTPIPPPQVYLAAHGNPQLPEIALTFDDGPSPGYTNNILAILEHYHIHATFFELGVWVQRYPDLSRDVLADGDVIGDHTWSHPDLTKLSNDQIIQQLSSTRDTIQQTTGMVVTLFRPPYDAYTFRVLDVAASLQFSTITWNVDPRDWSRPGTDAIIDRVLNATQNGSIILLHDGGGDRSQTVAALPSIIEQLQQRGYIFVTIPELLLHLPPPTGALFADQNATANAGLSATHPNHICNQSLTWAYLATDENRRRAGCPITSCLLLPRCTCLF